MRPLRPRAREAGGVWLAGPNDRHLPQPISPSLWAVTRRAAWCLQARYEPSQAESNWPGPAGPSRPAALRGARWPAEPLGMLVSCVPRENPVPQEQVGFLRGIPAEALVTPVVLDTPGQATLVRVMLTAFWAPPNRRNGVTAACAEHDQRQPSLCLLPSPPLARLLPASAADGLCSSRATAAPASVCSSPTARAGHGDSSRERGRQLSQCRVREEAKEGAGLPPTAGSFQPSCPKPSLYEGRSVVPMPWAAIKHPLAHSQEVRKRGMGSVTGYFSQAGITFSSGFRTFWFW